ncbi:MAG: 50S ribosomal protein L31 [Chloroflexi bacterium]|uniref:Large ribosomal subunit protein bL31 n=1 Tax=Candidatus Chlorohelix allophototropha TaxID=3003348 RepID=A0A8T7M107_9CHLR|nr:50S ribosomal protein L31 [Chloroflexota bacterium]WJW67069.1 50S ribosomal protein L31 [Chloroflexota bacterium L227-S17]
MKKGIHPRYEETTITCITCNTQWQTRSTRQGILKVELCAHCHPFYTGEQRIVDTAGQVDRFMKRLSQQRQDAKAKK